MFNFPSGHPTSHKPLNKYHYNRKTRQRNAIARAQAQTQEPKELPHLLDISIPELEQLLKEL